MTEQPTTIVEETMEDAEAAEKHRQDEEKRAAQMAQELEARTKQEEAAEAEAAAKRAAEEEVRKAEEQRRAEEARREEEMRQAEEARIADEERTRHLAELKRKDESKQKHRADILAALPKPISYVLDPESSFDIESKSGRTHIFRHFSQIQVFSEEQQHAEEDCSKSKTSTYWLPNVLAAPLLGPLGIELFVQSDHESFGDSLAGKWLTKEIPMTRLPLLGTFMDSLPPPGFERPPPMDENGCSLLSKGEQQQRRVSLLAGVVAANNALTSSKAMLRYVRLEDVLAHTHASLNGLKLDIRFDHLPRPTRPAPPNGGFFGGRSGRVDRPWPRAFVAGSTVNVSEFLRSPMHWKRESATNVRVVHEK